MDLRCSMHQQNDIDIFTERGGEAAQSRRGPIEPEGVAVDDVERLRAKLGQRVAHAAAGVEQFGLAHGYGARWDGARWDGTLRQVGDDLVGSQVASTVLSLAKARRLRNRAHLLARVEHPALAHFLEEREDIDADEALAGPSAPSITGASSTSALSSVKKGSANVGMSGVPGMSKIR